MIRIGIDYYPEHWNPSLWEEDCARMKELGTHVVRIAEFAWSRMEPKEGQYDFAWLDKAIDTIAAHDMQVILGTPTNCAPLWLYTNYPETVQEEGTLGLKRSGIRGHRCYNSPVFRKYAEGVIRQMASRYAGRKEIFAWQLDNELDNSHCTCPVCREKFRSFLKEKYGTLEALNAAYGNVVWSNEYSDWNQVQPPLFDGLPTDYYNTSLVLDFERFGASVTTDYVKFQVNLIREYDPKAVITTNACFPQHMPNFHEEFQELDVASYDNYPPVSLPKDPESLYSNAFALDFIRGFKQKNMWIMEEQAAQMGCWAPMSRIQTPGQLAGYGLQAVSHGADLLCFFRWRTATTGAEMFCHGLLDHNNKENRRYREVKALAEQLAKMPGLGETTPQSKVAILYGADQEFALKNQWQSQGYAYWTQMKLFHHACMSLGVNVDVIEETSSLGKYSVVIVPSHFVINPPVVAALEEFAAAGGTVLLTNRSGVKGQDGNCIMGQYLPTVFRRLAGCYVEEYDPIGEAKQNLQMGEKEYTITGWCDLLVLEEAEAVATYGDHYYKNWPAITRNAFGKGKAYYLGTIGEKQLYRDLLTKIFAEADIATVEGLPCGVELCSRGNETEEYVFLFNNTEEEKQVTYEGKLYPLASFGVEIIRRSFK